MHSTYIKKMRQISYDNFIDTIPNDAAQLNFAAAGIAQNVWEIKDHFNNQRGDQEIIEEIRDALFYIFNLAKLLKIELIATSSSVNKRNMAESLIILEKHALRLTALTSMIAYHGIICKKQLPKCYEKCDVDLNILFNEMLQMYPLKNTFDLFIIKNC